MNWIFLIENRILQFLTWSHVLCATEKKYYVSAIIFFENIKCYFKLDWKLLTEQEYLVRCTHSEFSKFRMPLTDREPGQLPYFHHLLSGMTIIGLTLKCQLKRYQCCHHVLLLFLLLLCYLKFQAIMPLGTPNFHRMSLVTPGCKCQHANLPTC